jgi:hypothetical protein
MGDVEAPHDLGDPRIIGVAFWERTDVRPNPCPHPAPQQPGRTTPAPPPDLGASTRRADRRPAVPRRLPKPRPNRDGAEEEGEGSEEEERKKSHLACSALGRCGGHRSGRCGDASWAARDLEGKVTVERQRAARAGFRRVRRGEIWETAA